MDKNKIVLHLIVILFACFSTTAAAQVEGTIADEKGQPLEFANVALLNAKDSAFVTGATTASNGRFVFSKAKSGNAYIVKITSVGFENQFISCSAPANVGTVRLKEAAVALQGVVVKGNRPFFKLADGGIQTNVAGTVLSKMGTASDVLAYVPGLVKQDDAYRVLGKDNLKIYINGHEVQKMSELDRLKSEDIKSVTLLKNPGAKYGAEIDAVVQIKTLRQRGDGFGIATRTQYNQGKYANGNGQVDLNYRHNGLDVFATVWGQDGTIDKSEVVNVNMQKNDAQWNVNNVSTQKRQLKAVGVEGGANYEINENNFVGAKYSYDIVPYSYFYYNSNTTVLKDDEKNDQLLYSPVSNSDRRPNHEVNAYYNGTLGKWAIDANIDFFHNSSVTTEKGSEKAQSSDSREVSSKMEERNTLWAAKLNLNHPLWGGNIDLGAEYTNTVRFDSYLNIEHYTPSTTSQITQQAIAPYFQYSRTIGPGQMNVGLRFERVAFDYNIDGKRMDNQSRSYNQWFPSVGYAFKVGNTQLQLVYGAKTQRATYEQISSSLIYSNRYQMKKGNPFLENTTKHTASLNGAWKFLQFSLEYEDQRNAIIYWGTPYDQGNNPTMLLSFKNVPSIKRLKPTVIVSPKIGFWQPTLTLGAVKPWLKLETGNEAIKFDKPIAFVDFANVFTFSKSFYGELKVYKESKGNVNNINYNYGCFIMDASITKTFFNDRLSIKLSGQDLFHQNQKKLTSVFSGILFTDNYKRSTRYASITIRYKFNMAQSKYKGTGAGEEERSRM